MATTLSLDYDRSIHGLPSGVKHDDLPALDFKPDATLTQTIRDELVLKRWRQKADARSMARQEGAERVAGEGM